MKIRSLLILGSLLLAALPVTAQVPRTVIVELGSSTS
jgi:hypothetical protein